MILERKVLYRVYFSFVNTSCVLPAQHHGSRPKLVRSVRLKNTAHSPAYSRLIHLLLQYCWIFPLEASHVPNIMSLFPQPEFPPSLLVFKLSSLYSSGSFMRTENENKGLCLKSRGRMEVKPIQDQSMCSQALRRNRCLWSPPYCGQDGELLLAALDLCLLYLKGTFLEKNFIHSVLGERTSKRSGMWLSKEKKNEWE